jgi:cytochrome bd-type quinol oxidase subunit 1
MESALAIHRLHFAFTITYHYLFPQLTMGLAPLIVLFKTLALWKGDERYDRAARFWAKIFAINFLFGVITGIPMEFQFGTNWAKFSPFSSSPPFSGSFCSASGSSGRRSTGCRPSWSSWARGFPASSSS